MPGGWRREAGLGSPCFFCGIPCYATEYNVDPAAFHDNTWDFPRDPAGSRGMPVGIPGDSAGSHGVPWTMG